ncbi:hypothetical protein QCA50_010745 [Cerrena zonata]|uniref:Uncharacterized protein n=1 Tax=Cerrena zonata TaxID=2478898 RepID=A0AAW0G8H8_9APHY
MNEVITVKQLSDHFIGNAENLRFLQWEPVGDYSHALHHRLSLDVDPMLGAIQSRPWPKEFRLIGVVCSEPKHLAGEPSVLLEFPAKSTALTKTKDCVLSVCRNFEGAIRSTKLQKSQSLYSGDRLIVTFPPLLRKLHGDVNNVPSLGRHYLSHAANIRSLQSQQCLPGTAFDCGHLQEMGVLPRTTEQCCLVDPLPIYDTDLTMLHPDRYCDLEGALVDVRVTVTHTVWPDEAREGFFFDVQSMDVMQYRS